MSISRPPTPDFTRIFAPEETPAPASLLDYVRRADHEITVRPRTHLAKVRITKPKQATRPATAHAEAGSVRTSTAQYTDHTQEIRSQHAVARLVRLREVGYRIEQLLVEDTRVEENHINAQRIYTEITTRRLDSRTQKRDNVSDCRQRNAIEQKEREDAAIAVKIKVYQVREEEGRRIRSAHANRVKHAQTEKEFAQHFVSTSRKVAQISEHQTRKREEEKVFRKLQEKIQTARSERKAMKAKYGKMMAAISELKQDSARADRERVGQRRDQEKEKHEQVMQKLRGWKEAERKIMASVQEIRKTPQFFYPNQVPTVETDEGEGAAFCIHEFLGANLGDTEAHLLADVIGWIL
jgi:DNA repair exonuclease SbcCD ATPase subunit